MQTVVIQNHNMVPYGTIGAIGFRKFMMSFNICLSLKNIIFSPKFNPVICPTEMELLQMNLKKSLQIRNNQISIEVLYISDEFNCTCFCCLFKTKSIQYFHTFSFGIELSVVRIQKENKSISTQNLNVSFFKYLYFFQLYFCTYSHKNQLDSFRK